MFFLQSDELLDHIGDIVHRDTQLYKFSFDLTVAGVHKFTSPGSLDFGGSEFEPAELERVEPRKKNPDDDYGWWELSQGSYKAVFNEQLDLPEDTVAVITPHQHADAAGLSVNGGWLTDRNDTESLSVTFHVPADGTRIKENARFATLYIMAE